MDKNCYTCNHLPKTVEVAPGMTVRKICQYKEADKTGDMSACAHWAEKRNKND